MPLEIFMLVLFLSHRGWRPGGRPPSNVFISSRDIFNASGTSAAFRILTMIGLMVFGRIVLRPTGRPVAPGP